MVKKLFLVAVCIGLAVNLYSDLRALDQNNTSIDTAKWVAQSHRVTKTIDSLRIGLLESLVSQSIGDQLHEDIRNLSVLVAEMPPQLVLAQKVAALTDKELLSQRFNPALFFLAEMSASEDAILQLRVRADEEANRQAVQTALYCNGIDIILIFLFLAFFIFERKSAENLQAALAKTLRGVESSNQKLQLAIARRDSRLKTTVHDLKNPLGTIKGFAELLYESKDKDSVIEMASIIQRISNNTLDLVGAVLEEKNSDFPPAKPGPVNLLESLKETCQFLEPIASEKGQRIQIATESCAFTLMGSKQQIQDVFFNVVGNALKFSPKGSVVQVECLDEGGYHQIRVKDQGPGFAKEDFSNIFVLGARLSAKPTGQEVSSGVGLFSARQTIVELGGSIDVANGVDGGACVSLRFPL